MKRLLSIIIILLIYTCGGNNSTGVVDDFEYTAEHKMFIENLLELNPGLSPDTLESRITRKTVLNGGIDYYQIIEISLNSLGLSNLPSSINYLDSLAILDISNNQLSELPDAICSLNIIDDTNFLFYDNLFCDPSTLPPCIIEIIDYTEQKCDVAYDEDDYQFIQEIIVANKIDTNGVNAVNNIYNNVHWIRTENKNEFDQFIYRIQKIEWDDKNISEIPETIGLLDSLNWIELEYNQIKTIPSMIGNLKKLEYLQLYDNGLENLPAGIGNLTNLQVLHIHNNALESLEFSFEQLTSLSEFWISNNNLLSLPESLCTLISSESLPASAFYYDGNNICISENACNLSISEQERDACD